MADRGTILNIVSWILLAVVTSTLIARLAMKLSMKTNQRRFGLDDLFIALAAVGLRCSRQFVNIYSSRFSASDRHCDGLSEATHALGQHWKELGPTQIDIYQKAEYAACMLYIANMGCARISVCLMIQKILPGIVANYTGLLVAGFTAIWMISGVLVSAFPCDLPHPWRFIDTSSCFDVVAFVNYIGLTNIVVEVLLVMIPLFIWNVRLSAWRTVSVSLVFLARLSIVAAVSAQLHFFNSSKLEDLSYDCWTTVLCQQIAQNLSVISACLPYLHPFIISILTGTTEPEIININYGAPPCIRQYLGRNSSNFDSTSSRASHASTTPFVEYVEEPYCRPLATYGLDRSSTHVHSQSVVRFPANVAKSIYTLNPPENFFNRLIEMPLSRPATSSSTTEPPKHLGEVGVLPIIDWDSDSSVSDSSKRIGASRRPTTEYVFNRSKVISITEETQLYNDGVKQFAPPLPSPCIYRQLPRAF